MKYSALLLTAAVGLAIGSATCNAADDHKKFGDACFMGYEGDQHWPTGEGAMVIKDFAVPIYIGLPTRSFTVVGRIYDERQSGVDMVGKGLAEGLFPEKDRQRDCAEQAKYRGADAIVVTGDDRVIKTLGLTLKAVQDTAPLFDHKDAVVLAVKLK